MFSAKNDALSTGFFTIRDCAALARERLSGHIVAVRHDEFLFVLPPPFLGVSSLNLAAPSGAAFFLRPA